MTWGPRRALISPGDGLFGRAILAAMNGDFSLITHSNVEVLVYLPWWREGVLHGITTSSLSFDRLNCDSSARVLQRAFQFSRLILPRQVHGSDVLDLRGRSRLDRLLREENSVRDSVVLEVGECDGILAPRSPESLPPGLAVGVLSADCVPVIIRSSDSWGLIHAGWRGLANGVISKAVRAMRGITEAVVFPCAGGGRYEVGREVIDAIGITAAHLSSGSSSDRFYLDTAGTAINQLRSCVPEIRVVSSGLCTISDPRFHSYRRDGEMAGRSVTLVRL